MTEQPTRGQRVTAQDIHRWGPIWSRRVGWVLDHIWWNTQVHGKENLPASGPVLIASNHTGIVDGPLLHGALPRGSHILVKQEFWDHWAGGPAMTLAGQIPVDRKAGRSALAVGKQLLTEGRVVGIFPEGTRGRGDVSEVRAGVAWLATQTQAPVVPVAVLGTRRPGDPRGYVPPARAKLHVVIGRPLDLQLEGLTGRAALTRAMEGIGTGMKAHVDAAITMTGVQLPD